MSVNGIGTAGYPMAGYESRKAVRSVESGAVGFMETIVEKYVYGEFVEEVIHERDKN